jgi:hypothetical protein
VYLYYVLFATINIYDNDRRKMVECLSMIGGCTTLTLVMQLG